MEKVPHSLVRTLRAIPDFAALDENTLLSIVGESINLVWRAGGVIFSPGDPGAALYVVLTGEVSIVYDEGSGERELARPGVGDSFGEMSLLLNAVHSTTARAITDCEILVLPKEAFTRILASNPRMASHFQTVLEERERGRLPQG